MCEVLNAEVIVGVFKFKAAISSNIYQGKIMNMRTLGMLAIMVASFYCNAVAEKPQDVFFPTLFWGNNAERGVMLVKPDEMVMVDSKGNKHEKVPATEDVSEIYISPNGEKLVYTTATGIWLVEIKTGQTHLVMQGDCYYLHWNADGLGIIFTVREYKNEAIPSAASFKFFWADGDGKNLKQVYP